MSPSGSERAEPVCPGKEPEEPLILPLLPPPLAPASAWGDAALPEITVSPVPPVVTYSKDWLSRLSQKPLVSSVRWERHIPASEPVVCIVQSFPKSQVSSPGSLR